MILDRLTPQHRNPEPKGGQHTSQPEDHADGQTGGKAQPGVARTTVEPGTLNTAKTRTRARLCSKTEPSQQRRSQRRQETAVLELALETGNIPAGAGLGWPHSPLVNSLALVVVVDISIYHDFVTIFCLNLVCSLGGFKGGKEKERRYLDN